MKYLPYALAAVLMLVVAAFVPSEDRVQAQYPCGNAPQYYPPAQPYYPPQVEYRERIVPVSYPVPYTVAVPVISYLYNGGYQPGYTPVFQAQAANQMPNLQVGQPPIQQKPVATGLSDEDIDKIADRVFAKMKDGTFASKPPRVPGTQGAADLDTQLREALSRPLGQQHKSCASCHTGSTAKKGFKIFTSPGVLNTGLGYSGWSKIYNRADDGTMPPEAEDDKNAALSDQEVDLIKQKRDQLKK